MTLEAQPRIETETQRPTILVIQARTNRDRTKHEQEIFTQLSGDIVNLKFINTLDEKFSEQYPDLEELFTGVNGAIFAGSADAGPAGGDSDLNNRLQDSYETLAKIATKKSEKWLNPLLVLAICLGHETISKIMGGTISIEDGKEETGTVNVRLNKRKHRWLKGLPEEFSAQVAHKAFATEKSSKLRIFGSTAEDPHSILGRRFPRTLLTTQFHAEMTTGQQMREAIEFSRQSSSGGYQSNGFFSDTPYPPEIIKNFFKDAVRRANRRSWLTRKRDHKLL